MVSASSEDVVDSAAADSSSYVDMDSNKKLVRPPRMSDSDSQYLSMMG